MIDCGLCGTTIYEDDSYEVVYGEIMLSVCLECWEDYDEEDKK